MNKSHPAADLLRQYSVGQMTDESAGELEQHLAECPQCEETLDNLAVNDETLISELRRPAPVDPVLEEPELQEALAQIVEHAAGVSKVSDGSANEAIGQEIGVYRLLEELGSGGMGTVYKALHTRLEKEVALKILATERLKDPHAVSRFDREMKAVGKLEHPHIVRAFDAGEADGQHFLVTEYVEGADLSQLSRKRGPLPIADACELARQAALGLEEAHEHGMVHRDIKPANLFLARQKGRAPMVKVLDLGLALIAGEHAPTDELTGTGQIMGTIDYMAPEQAGDTHNVDIRADIYSLGATLYRLLTGSSIYRSDKQQSVMQKLTALATQPAPPIQARRAEVPGELAVVVQRMLEKDPAARLATPAEVAKALEPFCTGNNLKALLQPVDAEPTLADAAANSASVHDGSVETQDEVDPGLLPTLISTQDHVDVAKTVVRSRSVGGVWARWMMGGLSVALLAAAGLYYSGILVKLRTPDGTLVIEVENAAAEGLIVEVNEKEQVVKIGADGKSVIVSVEPGVKQQIVVRTADGTVLKTDMGQSVEIVTGEKRKIKAWLEAANYALTFDGIDDYVEIPTLRYDGSHPITIEATVYANSVSGTVVGDAEGGGVALSAFDHPDTKAKDWLHFAAGFNNGTQFKYRHSYSDSKPITGQTICVAGVFDGNSVALFLDGELVQKTPFGEKFKPSPLPFMIGANPGLNKESRLLVGSWFFNGTIDEVRISKTARYSKDYRLVGRFDPDEQTLALYHFDDRDPLVLKDASGNGHHGKIVGAKRVESDSARLPKAQAEGWQPNQSQRAFLDRVAKLPAGEQVDAVRAKLREVNPGFDGEVTHRIDGGAVVEFSFVSDDVSKIWPVRGLAKLTSLRCAAVHPRRGKLADISPLAGMSLRRLILKGIALRDLSPLGGMQLSEFFCEAPNVTDLSPLRGMPLTVLEIPDTPVSDLTPITNMPLRQLVLSHTKVVDLSPLRGMALRYFSCGHTRIDDIAPLKGMPLVTVALHNTAVTDAGLQHLRGMTKLEILILEYSKVTPQGAADLQKILPNCAIRWEEPTIWNPTKSQQQFLDTVAKLPAGEQVEAVRKKLQEVNPGFDGRFVHGIEGGAVFKISFYSSDDITEIWPLRGFPQLSHLGCAGSEDGNSRLSNLRPLAGMRLSRLDCGNTQIADLSPLKGMPLGTLYFAQTDVSDLTPLQGLPLLRLALDVRLYDTQQHEFLHSLALEQLSDGRSSGAAVSDYWKRIQSRRAAAERIAKSAAALSGAERVNAVRGRLRELNSHDVEFRHVMEEGQIVEATLTLTRQTHDLTPLMALANLKTLRLRDGNNWLDISPVTHVPLEELTCKEAIARRNAAVLKTIATLKTINGKPAAEYWEALPGKMKPAAKESDVDRE